MTTYYKIHLNQEEVLHAIEPGIIEINLSKIENNNYIKTITDQLCGQINFNDKKYQGALKPLFQCKVFFLDKEVMEYKISLNHLNNEQNTPILFLNRKFLSGMDYENTQKHINYIAAENEKSQLEQSVSENKSNVNKIKL